MGLRISGVFLLLKIGQKEMWSEQVDREKPTEGRNKETTWPYASCVFNISNETL